MTEEERIAKGYEYMTAEQSAAFYATHPTIEHSRPLWTNDGYWKEKWKSLDVTVICCQRQTKVAIQLMLESLLRFYPDIPIIISDDDSKDDSAQYLQYKELVTPNLFVWMRGEGKFHGHGMQLDEMLKQFVKTKYCLLLDSDIIVERGGFLEWMIPIMEGDDNLYAIGTMHYASYINNGGEPFSPEDAIPYPHPQCSLIRADKYLKMDNPFIVDGAPLILNMKEAFDKKMGVAYYPTDKFISHRGGSSYVKPIPVWSDDHDVYLRPFVTFIIAPTQRFITDSSDSDFDIVIAKNFVETEVVLHKREAQKVKNNIYDLRFKCNGEYVCDARNSYVQLEETFISRLKDEVIKQSAPDELIVDGLRFVKRNVWQQNDSLL